MSGAFAVICDLDGTLANTDHRVSHVQNTPKDWDSWNAKMGADALYEHVHELLVAMAKQWFTIYLITGRSEQYREVTKEWLKEHEVPYDYLLMRPAGDLRSDTIVKEELFNTTRLDPHHVAFALEDRDKVVDMWRSLGINCFQVRRGDY
jgi:hypothetical protein